ncbi:MAG: PspA/IM30 family protein [Candidatus Electrothrix aestuarii]|uniref:PspA/IM30 family protein n=1 Tax=Candidatus Electrothrix aestuarii TaxID=3062594 RepID=A0AAU8LSL5_9BACT|nr:PspA/IM30 family protein [Candidatus Electrothrix aestuarii]
MSSIFKRVSDIINANLNDLIDRLEDPERVIKQIIREMEDNIRQAKEGVVNAIASEKQLFHELEKHRNSSQEWLSKAETALQADKEDLARSALARKKEIDQIITSLEPAWASAKATSDRLKAQLLQLENKLEETKRKRTTLLARQRATEARQQMDSTMNTFHAGLDAQARFDRMEDKVEEMEARAEAMDELHNDMSALENEFLQLETDNDVETELNALKMKMQKNAG